jgi:hypothetical protein
MLRAFVKAAISGIRSEIGKDQRPGCWITVGITAVDGASPFERFAPAEFRAGILSDID